MQELTVAQIQAAVREAKEAAYEAADHYFKTKLGGRDQYACGFAWVNIYGVKGSTKLGRAMLAAGLRKDWTGKSFQLWNPAKSGTQSISALEAGAEAAAQVFKSYGFEAYAGSRLD